MWLQQHLLLREHVPATATNINTVYIWQATKYVRSYGLKSRLVWQSFKITTGNEGRCFDTKPVSREQTFAYGVNSVEYLWAYLRKNERKSDYSRFRDLFINSRYLSHRSPTLKMRSWPSLPHWPYVLVYSLSFCRRVKGKTNYSVQITQWKFWNFLI